MIIIWLTMLFKRLLLLHHNITCWNIMHVCSISLSFSVIALVILSRVSAIQCHLQLLEESVLFSLFVFAFCASQPSCLFLKRNLKWRNSHLKKKKISSDSAVTICEMSVCVGVYVCVCSSMYLWPLFVISL